MRFDWDPTKNDLNIEKHGIAFETAILLFAAAVVYVYRSDRKGEERYTAVGLVERRLIAVAYTDRVVDGHSVRRIISARRAQDRERKAYDAQDR